MRFFMSGMSIVFFGIAAICLLELAFVALGKLGIINSDLDTAAGQSSFWLATKASIILVAFVCLGILAKRKSKHYPIQKPDGQGG